MDFSKFFCSNISCSLLLRQENAPLTPCSENLFFVRFLSHSDVLLYCFLKLKLFLNLCFLQFPTFLSTFLFLSMFSAELLLTVSFSFALMLDLLERFSFVCFLVLFADLQFYFQDFQICSFRKGISPSFLSFLKYPVKFQVLLIIFYFSEKSCVEFLKLFQKAFIKLIKIFIMIMIMIIIIIIIIIIIM